MHSIIDGDTITVTVQSQTVTVRLLGIDTPEKRGGPRPAECFGAEATAFIAGLIPVGTAVDLSRDEETRDQYGRTLAWVHRHDGVLVNLAMVESGHASSLFFTPNDAHEDLFDRAAWGARRSGRGFWAACGGPDVALAP
ncbi:MAG: thermonuclease family protein [Actinomycetota bacterium]